MPKNILVVRLSSLGDVVLTAPVYRNLKAHWPDCRITVLVRPAYAAVLEGNPDVDEILPFVGQRDAIRQVRGRKFTHLLDLHNNFRSWQIRRASGIPLNRQVVYKKDALARRLFVAFRTPAPALDKHTLDRYLDALSRWEVPIRHRALEMPATAPKRRMDLHPGKILVVQTAFIGDAVLTLPLLRKMRALFPDSRLAVLTRPETVDLFKNSDAVDEVIVDDKRGLSRGPLGAWRMAQDLKRMAFDLAVVPHRSLRSAFIARAAEIPIRVGFHSSVGAFLFTQTVPFSWLMHDVERNMSLLAPFTDRVEASPNGSRFLKRSDPSVVERVRQELERAGWTPDTPLIGIHSASVWATKRWLPERFAELIRRLKAEVPGAMVVLIGGPKDTANAEEVWELSGRAAVNIAGKTSLRELIELMRYVDVFISNDSGPMHIATACRVPTLGIFGPTTRELGFFPYGPSTEVVEVDLKCRPCGLHGHQACPERHFLCMRLIRVEDVLAKALVLLERGRAAKKEAVAS